MAPNHQAFDPASQESPDPKPSPDSRDNEKKEVAETIAATMPIALLVLETDLRVRMASQTFYDTFQVTPETTEGQLVYDLGNGQWNIPQLRTLLEEILPNNQIFANYEVEHTFEEIGHRSMLLNGRRLDDVQLILLVITDITKRKQSEEALRTSEERFKTIARSTQDAIWDVNMMTNTIWWSEGVEKPFGYSREELESDVGAWNSHIHPADLEEVLRSKESAAKRGEDSWSGEYRVLRKDGSVAYILERAFLMRDDQGILVRRIGSMVDLTERKQLEAQYLRAQRMESIGTLAGGIAHDLNNVLTPILLALGMLKRKPRPADEVKLFNMLETSAQHGAAMVRQVLAFARGVEGERIAVNVGLIILELQILIHDTFDRNIYVQVNIEDALPTILADPTQIHQVLLNLAINARDAMPHGGKLEFTASALSIDAQYVSMHPDVKPGSYVMLTVSDSGTGIPVAIRDRIFDPFFTTKAVGIGTGLGLANVQSVIKSHGGFINVYSEEGRGTEFKIYLPAFREIVQDNLLTTAASSAHQGHGELILVVDDDAAVRLVSQQTLEAFGYRVVIAEDGAEAVAVYVEHKNEIAVVLTDMMMPIMDGFVTIHALRKINPSVKIIATSGLAANAVVSKAVNEGVKHFLEKPYTAEAMFKVLGEALAEGRSE